MSLFDKPIGIRSHWISFENAISERGQAALENQGAKGHAFDCVRAGETKTLLDLEETGMICRIWMTIGDRSPEMLRSLRLEMFWDQSDEPAVSTPLGDFFGVGLGRRTPFENALFSDPEGRSFNCFIPMPFRTGARVTLTNESEKDLAHLFYDIDLLLDVEHTPSTLYFHTHWRREAPNELGKEYTILPKVVGAGRFLGCNIGIMPDPAYEGAWWGEGEVKVWFGDDDYPTLCGTGTEDYIGTGWGQGVYANRTQGCLIADKEAGQWCFYRFHLDLPGSDSDDRRQRQRQGDRALRRGRSRPAGEYRHRRARRVYPAPGRKGPRCPRSVSREQLVQLLAAGRLVVDRLFLSRFGERLPSADSACRAAPGRGHGGVLRC